MRDPVWAFLTAVALATVPAQGAARAADGALGTLVVSGRSVCRVEAVNGPWLSLVADGEGGKPARGWARADQIKSLDRAIADDTARIAARPDPALYYDRGRFWHARGEFNIAIADFDKVLHADPRCARAYYHRGRAWTDKGAEANDDADIRRGLADFDSAIRLDPASVAFYCERGSAWVKLGKIYMGKWNDGETRLEELQEWVRRTQEYEAARRKWEALSISGGPADPDAPKANPDGPVAESQASAQAAGAIRQEYLNIIKYARIDCGAAFRNASDDFDAAIRLDPKDPRGATRRDQLRGALPADDAGTSTPL